MSQPSNRATIYKGYRFPPAIISRCVWLYYRFGVSLRDVSELMLARGIEVSHEAIRLWTLRFGMEYARRLKRTRGACSNIWHLDELCLTFNGSAAACGGRSMTPARFSTSSFNAVGAHVPRSASFGNF
jgi:transposase-like protein